MLHESFAAGGGGGRHSAYTHTHPRSKTYTVRSATYLLEAGEASDVVRYDLIVNLQARAADMCDAGHYTIEEALIHSFVGVTAICLLTFVAACRIGCRAPREASVSSHARLCRLSPGRQTRGDRRPVNRLAGKRLGGQRGMRASSSCEDYFSLQWAGLGWCEQLCSER